MSLPFARVGLAAVVILTYASHASAEKSRAAAPAARDNAHPGEANGLKLTNVRTTHGLLGPVRAENEVLPGGAYSLAFDIEGVRLDPAGTVRYSTALEVKDAKGKVIYKQEPRDLEAVAALGGKRIPAFARLDIGLDQPPGEYTLTVTVKDLASGKSQSLTRSARVKPAGFGIIRLTATTDQDGQDPAAALAVGQSLWVGAGVVGFARDKATGNPHVRLSLRVLDEDRKATLEKPFVGEHKDIAKNVLLMPVRFYLLMNRPGKFTVELAADDLVARKSDKLTFPITVLDANTNTGKPK